MNILKTMAQAFGMVTEGNEEQGFILLRSSHPHPSEASIHPLLVVSGSENGQGLRDLDSPAKVELRIDSGSTAMGAWLFPTAKDALVAVATEACLVAMLWDALDKVPQESVEAVMDEYASLTPEQLAVKDDADLTMCEYSELVLASLFATKR